MTDPTPRLIKVGDALSQLLNVLLLPNHTDTTANESISGRSYRCGWVHAQRAINAVFRVLSGQKDHCREAYEMDRERAQRLILRDSQRPQ